MIRSWDRRKIEDVFLPGDEDLFGEYVKRPSSYRVHDADFHSPVVPLENIKLCLLMLFEDLDDDDP